MIEFNPPQRYLDLLNCATFSKGVMCVFEFTDKLFCVARDDVNQILMEGLVS